MEEVITHTIDVVISLWLQSTPNQQRRWFQSKPNNVCYALSKRKRQSKSRNEITRFWYLLKQLLLKQFQHVVHATQPNVQEHQMAWTGREWEVSIGQWGSSTHLATDRAGEVKVTMTDMIMEELENDLMRLTTESCSFNWSHYCFTRDVRTLTPRDSKVTFTEPLWRFLQPTIPEKSHQTFETNHS